MALDGVPQMDKLDEASKKELSEFLNRESSNARLQTTIHELTSMCWDKCITSTPGNYFSSGERTCLENCVDRFLDTSLFMVKTLQSNSRGDL